jgi:hypothetical protein
MLRSVCWQKERVSRYTPRRHLGGEEGRCSSYSFLISALDGVSGQHHAPAALYPRGTDPPVPIVQEGLGLPQSRSGRRG